MTTERITLAAFIEKYGLRMDVKPTDHNPNMEGGETMDHWRCRVRGSGKRSMTLTFSKGSGHNGAEPVLSEVLDCLASDSSSIENAKSFEDWASEFGYDTDSRKAHKTFRTCEKQAAKLKAVLGDEAYEELLWNTERE